MSPPSNWHALGQSCRNSEVALHATRGIAGNSWFARAFAHGKAVPAKSPRRGRWAVRSAQPCSETKANTNAGRRTGQAANSKGTAYQYMSGPYPNCCRQGPASIIFLPVRWTWTPRFREAHCPDPGWLHSLPGCLQAQIRRKRNIVAANSTETVKDVEELFKPNSIH